MPIPARDGPSTDLLGGRAPVQNDPNETSGEVPATQVVRTRGRPGVVPEDFARSFDPPTDLMYYDEPELPASDDSRTRRNVVDEGPTQVDYDISSARPTVEHNATIPTPIVLPESAPTEATLAPSLGPLIQKRPSGEALDLRHVATVLDSDTIDEPMDGLEEIRGTEGFVEDSGRTDGAGGRYGVGPTEGTEKLHGFEQYIDSIPPIVEEDDDDDSSPPLVKPLRAPDMPAMDEDLERAMEGLRQAAESQAATAQDSVSPHVYSSKTRTDVELQPSPVRSSQELDAGFLHNRKVIVLVATAFVGSVLAAMLLWIIRQ
jgi:hypothetical protein